jgi:hypothetical protein
MIGAVRPRKQALANCPPPVTNDSGFGSPSTAARVVMGLSVNGRIDGKTADGRSLEDIQDAAAGG